jgi:hypothetical protein
MSQTKLPEIIKAVAENYNYSFAQWQPDRIRKAIEAIDNSISPKLDYSNADNLLSSIRSLVKEDITPYIVESNYPVWAETNDIVPKPKSKRLVITYLPPDCEIFNECVNSISKYSKKVNSDFVLLQGRTQGSLLLEKFRVKRFIEAYDRTIYFDYSVLIMDNCPNLFDIVPEDHVGLYDNLEEIENNGMFFRYKKTRMRILKAEAFTRYPALTQTVLEPLEYESDQMKTWYDFGVVVCNKKHSNIFCPISFPFSKEEDDDNKWMEVCIHRDGYPIFNLSPEYNFGISLNDNTSKKINQKYIYRYKRGDIKDNVQYTWLYDNNIIGYKKKPKFNMDEVKVLCLGHKAEQFDSIKDRDYLSKINLNELKTSFGNEYSESRIYDISFDELFPPDKKYVGIVTASWNHKYVGLNPIDEMHNWAALNYLSDNKILCANVEPSLVFIDILYNILRINKEQINQFFDLIQLKPVSKTAALSNNIIAKREIVEELFDFYQNNNILEKIGFFVDSNKISSDKPVFEIRKNGYLTEFVTVLWLANKNFIMLPQDIRKLDWY